MIAQVVRKFLKAGTIAANDFAGAVTGARDGDLAQDASARLFMCVDQTSSTSVWVSIPVQWRKSSALAANDFAGPSLLVGDLGVNTSNGVQYTCTASNGSTTSTWVVVGTQT